MKRILLFVLIISNSVFATETEKESNSKITKATVFLDGAQITRESKLGLSKGKTILKFKELSPYIDKNSIKVKGTGDFTILSVNHDVNFLKVAAQNPESELLNNEIEKLTMDIEYKKTELDILNEKKNFLVSNKNIISNEKSTSPADFKLFKEIYSTDLETIQIALLKKQREIDALNKKIKTINKQVTEISSIKDLPTSEITVTVISKTDTKGEITISYYVSNAGWYPSYDIRVDDIESPVKLIYKANVYQNIGVNWDNIMLTFSNASPTESANIPSLNPYYLDFNHMSNATSNFFNYNPNVREVNGIVNDSETGEAVPFANVMVKDKTIGTTTDYDGKFSLSIPQGAKSLLITFVGYETKEVVISNSYLNIPLKPSALMMNEVVVAAYGISKASRKNKNEQESIPIPVEMNSPDYKTNFEFNIEVPYTLKSNSANLTIEMNEIELQSLYLYKTVPKINPQAFLMANVIDWEQYSLLDGEVNLYFENTFVGKSILDLAQLSDTLEVSLGSDKNISVKRTKEKELSSKQFLGGNKIESRIWKTTIKNNKSEKIKILVFDQIPISNNEEISVEINNLSEGTLNKLTGEVMWELELNPKESIEKKIEYSVKYPKKKILRIE